LAWTSPAPLGVCRSGWFFAAQFGLDKAVITHVTHSDWYRTYSYPEAKDGWYRDPGGTFHYGLSAGFTVGRAELLARYGMLRTEEFNELTPPMHASIGLGLAFEQKVGEGHVPSLAPNRPSLSITATLGDIECLKH
jgi:hypothetical protein